MQEQDLLQTAKGDSPIQEEASNIVAHNSASAAMQNAATMSGVSGLYLWKRSVLVSSPIPQSSDPIPRSTANESDAGGIAVGEELRIDVDGRYPQMVASGVIHGGMFSRVHWIANMIQEEPNLWTGGIFYTEGNKSSFPYKAVRIQVIPNAFPSQRKAEVTLSGGGSTKRTRVFKFASPNFHTVDFEFDFVEGEKVLLDIKTHAHPNRPSTLENEDLSVITIFERAGFAVTTTPGGKVPIKGAGQNKKWSYQEMHDAMQKYWSHFDSKAQWAMWVFFAGLNEEDGKSLGGIMFDDIGAQHRQGTAIFNNSFIADPPARDKSPEDWVRRMNFWTTCHEMGHCFNLAHAWEKGAGSQDWIPLRSDAEARSFMNYPYNVKGGQSAFFADFEFRFGDGELLFMRHAPERFVQMGNAEWFDNHGFREANVSPEPKFELIVRVNRPQPAFEFMEPVVLELKLTNTSNEPQMVHDKLLSTMERITLVIKKKDKPARQYAPHAQFCWQPKNKVLNPGESLYESLFASAGRNGWEISEPGYYLVQVALDMDDEDLISEPLMIRITPPHDRYTEEYLAQDVFSDEVGRILTFDGSRFLEKGNDVLREVAAQLPNSRLAIHCNVPLGKAFAKDYKYLELGDSPSETAIKVAKPDTKESGRCLSAALTGDMNAAAETLGHVDFKSYLEAYEDSLRGQGDKKRANDVREKAYVCLKNRGVKASVLEELKTGSKRGDVEQGSKKIAVSVPAAGAAKVSGGVTSKASSQLKKPRKSRR
jgi:hypothetical protein